MKKAVRIINICCSFILATCGLIALIVSEQNIIGGLFLFYFIWSCWWGYQFFDKWLRPTENSSLFYLLKFQIRLLVVWLLTFIISGFGVGIYYFIKYCKEKPIIQKQELNNSLK